MAQIRSTRPPRRVARKTVAGASRREAVPPDVASLSPRARSVVMRLAAEVEALAAQLDRERARAGRLEAAVAEDPLTGLLNRRGFERELARAIAYVARYGTPAALLYADLDGFKAVNDTHGHAAGDRLLCATARALLGEVRRSDIVARMGGDEFALVLWNIGADDARKKVTAIEEAVRSAHDGPAGAGISIGCVILDGTETTESALARADAEMYARKAGRGGAALRR